MIEPRIEILTEKKIIGKKMIMSLAENKTPELWKSFILRKSEIKNSVSNDLISIQVYDLDYFKNFSPMNQIEKWASLEVEDFDFIPKDMETFILKNGLYAVFDYKGSSNDPKIFQYIYSIWLPKSGYVLDHRPHFEVLSEKYKHNDPSSEEEIWIPIKKV